MAEGVGLEAEGLGRIKRCVLGCEDVASVAVGLDLAVDAGLGQLQTYHRVQRGKGIVLAVADQQLRCHRCIGKGRGIIEAVEGGARRRVSRRPRRRPPT